MTSPAADRAVSTPVFGRRKTAARRIPFQLVSYDNRDRETTHDFTARAGIDASTALQVNTSDAARQARAVQNLLIRCLVDDDGISRDDRPRRLDDPDGDPGTDLDIPGGSDIGLAGETWVIGEDDTKTFPSRSLADDHGTEHGSSLRRFAALMDDPMESVELSALREIVNFLQEESAGRPTQRSGGSSPRRTPRKGRR